jgi:hypothetical protein
MTEGWRSTRPRGVKPSVKIRETASVRSSYRSICFQRADDDRGSIAPMEASENVLLGERHGSAGLGKSFFRTVGMQRRSVRMAS